MLSVAYMMPAVSLTNGPIGKQATHRTAKLLQQQSLLPPTPPQPQQQQLQQQQQQQPEQHNQHQLTNSELYEIRQRHQRDKREEVTWETSSYDRDRGRMVRSLNIVERNRLAERTRQLDREMEQRMRDIRHAQSAVVVSLQASTATASASATTTAANPTNRLRRRAASQQELPRSANGHKTPNGGRAAPGGGSVSCRSHSGNNASRFL